MAGGVVGWHFPPTGGGKEDGYNDSGVAHFSGTPLYSLARETIQNSLDARKLEGEPVEVAFELIAVEPEDIGSVEFTRAVKSSIVRAQELPDRDAERALGKALDVLNSGPIHCLRVSDLNTTGLRAKNWQALVKMQGFSQKDDAGAGGSHGIGKYAPFAVSALRTVFYWTCYAEDAESVEKLQGKAVLMSHDTTIGRTQGTGFYGVKEECEAFSDAESIPDSLRRLNADRMPLHGTALVIAGFSEESNWQQRIASSVIENYFYAIAKGALQVRVDPGVNATNLPDVQIDDTNLSQWFEMLEDGIASDDDEDGSALKRAKAYCELVNDSVVPAEKQDGELGHCKLYVRVGDGLPSRVALVRRTGMLVTDQQTNLLRFPLHQEFAAICIFEDPSGNELLRRMENPQHDRFEYNRLPEEERSEGRQALRRITSWIRDEIRKQAGPKEASQTTVLSELAAYLPDLHPDEPFDGADDGSNEGTQERGFGERITMSLKPIRKSGPALPKGKVWPHPVLRPPEYGDDYPNAEFEVEIDCRRDKGSVAVEMTVEFALSDPDLLQLVEDEAAEYVVLVKSTKTHFRKEFRSKETLVSAHFTGQLSGRVEISSFLVCVQRQAGFKAEGWHRDFAERTFDLEPGVVLAEDKPKEYWIDAADEAPIGAIFEHRLGARQEGEWQCNLDSDRVQILLSDTDSNRFQHARESANNTPDAQYLMNGLYLPVLIHVLSAADESPDVYGEYRWFDSLNRRLEAVGCEELGRPSADRSVDAQKVLEQPFVKMPMMADADEES